MQKIGGYALAAQVWLGQWLTSLGGPEQLLQPGAVEQGVWQSQCNVCQMDCCKMMMYGGIAVLQVIVKVGDIDHKSVFRSQKCLELVPIAEVLEHLLLTLVHSACVVLNPFLQLDPGSAANPGQQNRRCSRL